MSSPATTLSLLITRIVASVMSIVQAAQLRDKLYQQREEHELMWTALDDIARMYKDTEPGDYAERTLTRINSHYGRR